MMIFFFFFTSHMKLKACLQNNLNNWNQISETWDIGIRAALSPSDFLPSSRMQVELILMLLVHISLIISCFVILNSVLIDNSQSYMQ